MSSSIHQNDAQFQAFLVSSDAVGGGLKYLLRTSPQETCQTPRRPWLLGTHPVLKQVVFFQPNCKLWACPHCAKINAAKWTFRAANGIKEFQSNGHVMRHVTITSHEKLKAEATVRVLPSAWKKLSMRYRREAEFTPYFLVPERHEDLRLHLHMLTVAGCDERWWKDNARSSGFGHQVKDRGIVSADLAAMYVAKYTAKSIKETRWKKGFNRVRTSQNWPPLPELATPEGWEFVLLDKTASLADLAQERADLGYTVIFATSEQGWSIIDTVGQGGR